jgi:hypothetical protein
MSHPEQLNFVKAVRNQHPNNFKNCNVLEVGSLNINGSVRSLFKNCNYLGIDVGPGIGVDLVCEGQKYNGPDRMYDTTISCECFEHNPYWLETFFNMWRMTKLGGLVIVTCATIGRGEHGTKRTTPQDSPLTIEFGWEDYYKNLTEQDFITPLNFGYLFEQHGFQTNNQSHDLYFVGIKNTKL